MWVTGVHPESSQTPGWVVRDSAGQVLGFHPDLMEGFQAKRQKHQGISKGFTWDLGNTITLVCGHGWSSVWHTKFGSPLWLHVSFFPVSWSIAS